MGDRGQQLVDLDIKLHLLKQLAVHGLLRGLSGLNLAPGELPMMTGIVIT